MSDMDMKSVIATEHIQDYLLYLAKVEGREMVNLAALAVIQEFLKQEDGDSIKTIFLNKGLLDSLLIALDTGMEGGINLGMMDVSLKSLWLLSKLSIGPLQPLITDNVIRRLLMVMNVDGVLFQYSSVMQSELQKMCENKNVIGKVSTQQMSVELIKQISKLSNGKLQKLTKLPNSLNMCSLYDTNEDDIDIDFAQDLINKKLVWSSTDSANSDGLWEDIAITHIIDGPLFWAHIGISKMEKVRLIQTFLQACAEDLDAGDIKIEGYVVVCSEFDGMSLYVRAQILYTENYLVKVWALDYGFILDVKADQIFELPEDVSIEKHPPSVSLCCLAGVQAPPKCATMVEVAAATLCNLSKKSFPAGDIINKHGGLEVAEHLLETCTDDIVNIQVIRLVNNLSCNVKLANAISQSRLVKILIGKCKQYMKYPEGHQGELFTTSLTCLCNLIFKNEENRKKFYEHQGIETTLKILMMSKYKSSNYMLACQLLKVFLWKIDLQSPPKSMQSRISTTESGKSRAQAINRLPTEAAKLVKEQDLLQEIQPKGFQQTIAESRLLQECSSDDDEEVCYHGNTVSGDDSDGELLLHNHESAEGSKDKMVLYSRQQSLPERYYILDSEVDFDNDSTHEIRSNKTLTKVSASVISGHVCGMMNQGKGGTIFFGITTNCRVNGIEMSRDDRDEFRLGVDRMMERRINPALLHSMYEVIYIPVADVDSENRNIRIIPDLYIVEIVLQPHKGTLYLENKEDICYYRHGPNTSQLSIMELRDLIIFEEEEEYREQIIHSRLELQELKKSYV